MKIYKLFIRYWYGQVVDIIKTKDLYHYVGKLFLSSTDSILRIDYKELESEDSCQIYDPCCKLCRVHCKKYLGSKVDGEKA